MKIFLLLMIIATTDVMAQECVELNDDMIQCKVEKSVCIFKTVTCYDVE